MNLQLPKNVIMILDTLKLYGFDGYVVGGCVRDKLLDKTPVDWDICTNATPKEVMAILSKICNVLPTGIKHGTITAVIDDENFEVTTFRTDGKYSDCRRPDNVFFTNSIFDDLSRRDFTINAIAYNPFKGLIDPFHGIEDIKNRRLSCVGNANYRMREDYLRALRAVRFACQLDFNIEKDTVKAIIENNNLIKYISRERIRDEFCKIILSDRPGRGIFLLKNFKLLDYIIPEFEKNLEFINKKYYPDLNLFESICSNINDTPENLIIRLSILLNYANRRKEEIEKLITLIKELKFDNYTINKIITLIKENKNIINLSDKEMKKIIIRTGIDNINNYFSFIHSIYKIENKNQFYSEIISNLEHRCHNIISEKQPLSVKELDIDGNDLINLGFKQGKLMGIVLNRLLDMVLENPELNNKQTLLQIAKQELKNNLFP